MPRIYDCFLYNDERELLAIRLQLLAHIVHTFVIVWSSETFTGLKKRNPFPRDLLNLPGLKGKIKLIELGALGAMGAWNKEAFSRNSLGQGIADAESSDLIMVSDVDEIPRPSSLAELVGRDHQDNLVVLGQDYFNFKFNYQLVHGLQAVWPGPVLCRFQVFKSAQELRDKRWILLEDPNTCLEDAGWHFSFLTATAEVSNKLASFSHQEERIQSRRENIESLVATRQGFHDHMHPGSVWAVVPLNALRCASLERLTASFPQFVISANADDRDALDRAIRHSVRRMRDYERSKIAGWYRWGELLAEMFVRLKRRLLRAFHKK